MQFHPLLWFTLTLSFSHFVGDTPLDFSTTYKNAFGEPFSIQQCKYYVSAIRITGDDGTIQTILGGSHLVDAADSSTLTLRLNTNIAKISRITFDMGVDSEANTSGVHSGDLDPMLGMFWTWNTGYIYARLEGQSDSAHAPAHRFTWDVGGYRPGVDATREVVLSLPGSASSKPRSSSSDLNSPSPRVLDIKVNLLHWFDGKHPIHLSQSPICHQPGALAMQLADNYATLFSITP